MEIYDLVIIGAGPAGLTASIYASRYKINHLVFGEPGGGQILMARDIQNYPGFSAISGVDLIQKMREQVESYGVKIRDEVVTGLATPRHRTGDPETQKPIGSNPKGLDPRGGGADHLFEITTKGGEKIQARAVILAMGAQSRTLNVPGETDFIGRGVSYCGLCDGPLYRDKTVAVIGGGDSAVVTAVHLAALVKKLYLIHRKAEFRAEPFWLERLKALTNVELVMERNIVKVIGDKELATQKHGIGDTEIQKPIGSNPKGLDPRGGGTEVVGGLATQKHGIETETQKRTDPTFVGGIELDQPYNSEKILKVDGVFVEIGSVPAVTLAAGIGVILSPDKFIVVSPDMATNVAGIFAAGDIATQAGSLNLRQVITAAGEGAEAAASTYRYLNGKSASPLWGKS